MTLSMRLLFCKLSLFLLIPVSTCFMDRAAYANNDLTDSASSHLIAQTVITDEKVDRVGDLPQVSTTIKPLLAQESSPVSPIKITGVKVNPTATGVEIALESASANIPQPTTKREGNTLTVSIPDATLNLPEGKEFQAKNPAKRITSVLVTQDGNNVRISVMGSDAVPAVNFVPSASGLMLNLTASEATDEDEIEVTVTDEQQRGYRAPNTSTATKTDTPIRDIPQSIQVIPRQILEDRNVTRVGEALQNVSGIVNQEGGYSGYEDFILIRGFQASTFAGNFYRDGVPYFTFGFPETANLESIEVLKGPASVLFGRGQPGGIINLVSKQPLRDPYYSVSATVGSFNSYRSLLDFSAPLNEDKSLRYRLNILYENSRSFRDFVRSERFFISPVIVWDISPNTSLRIDGEFLTNNNTMDDGIPAIGRSIANVPSSRFLSEPFSNFRKDELSIGYLLSHKFNDDWSARHTLRYQSINPERYYPSSDSLDEATGELSRIAYYAAGNYNQLFANAEVVGKFLTGSIPHKLLFGVEYRRNNETPEFDFNTPYPSIDIFNPIYINQPYTKIPTFFRDDNYTTLAAYVQDQIDLLPNLKLLLGVRYDNFQQFRTTRNLGESRQEFSQTDSAFSPRVGIVYQPSDAISLYASYTRSFVPSFGTSRNPDNSVFKPETGTQYEIGIKAALSDRLSLTLAAFDLKKQNVTTADPNDPQFSIQTGEQTSRGIEFDLAGEILPGWSIIASYANINAFVSADNALPVGNRLDNVPRNQASLWTRYDIQEGDLKGLGFGLGVYYVGERPGDLNDTFTLPSYLRTDAAIFYKRDNWKAQLNFRNLFNAQYVSASSFGSGVGINPGAPFSVSGTIAIEF
jgi:iron complex outermembrane recepter protein